MDSKEIRDNLGVVKTVMHDAWDDYPKDHIMRDRLNNAMRLVTESIAALSTMDPEAIKEKVKGEGDYWMVSSYPTLKEDDPLRRAYFAGVHDAESKHDPEAIRREERSRLVKVIRSTVEGRPQEHHDFNSYMRGCTDTIEDVTAILGAEPAQDDGKAEGENNVR